MSNGINFRKMSVDLRAQLTTAQSDLAALREELAGWKHLVGAVCATIPLAQTLAGTATQQSMVQYFKGLHAERDNLQKYLAAAEQRNAESLATIQLATKLLGDCKANLNQTGRLAKDIRAFLDSRHKANRLAAKPTESGASE